MKTTTKSISNRTKKWNDTYVNYPSNAILHKLVEEQAQRTPEAVAIIYEDKRLTYSQLEQRANQLARKLLELEIGPDKLVAVLMDRSLEMVVALLGILKAGGAYVPLDPGYPQERLSFMLNDARAPVLLTQSKFLGHIETSSAHCLCLDTEWSQIDQQSVDKPDVQITPDHLAYVIYTSGSTGKPKGVMISHRAICNRLFGMQDQYALTADDLVLQKTPFSFDVSVWEFFWPLLSGAQLVLAKPGGHKDSAYLAHLIKKQQISVLHFVPSMLAIFLDEPRLEKYCPSLRHVICGGETLSCELQNKYFSRLSAKLHHLYGPTEAAIDVSYWQCRKDGAHHIAPIGRPVANTQLYILDGQMKPVVAGKTGELHIGGVQVARGYLNRPELTAEKFIEDPFSKGADKRLYKTGDLARYLPDGNIQFLGRIDHQVKIRGFRIELGEIEYSLETYSAIKQAVVIVREDEPGMKHLVAYCVLNAGQQLNMAEIRKYLQEKIPDYMVPAAFVELGEMPLTPNGKADRSALPAPERHRPELDKAYVAPRDDLEIFIAELWRELLNLDQIGIHDRFFELGGDSIQAARFIARLQKKLGESIYVATIFEAPSIAEYADFLKKDYSSAVSCKFMISTRVEPRRLEKNKITQSDIDRMRECTPMLPEWKGKMSGPVKNPPALFILAPPRSGTTLLRVMLAGHPKLFAAAELQLLGFNTLKERREAFTGKFSLWLEGSIRAIMEIKNCDADQAKIIMEDFEHQNLTTKQFFAVLQEWLGQKMLMDKSPAYALDPGALGKAERDFKNPLYIHLVRHPYAMVHSFENHHMDQVLFMHEQPFLPRKLGELLWLLSHQNIVDFLKQVPQARQYRLKFEDLVTNPHQSVAELCNRLGLDFHESMVNPYHDLDKKMTDGIYKDSKPMGDTRLLKYKAIDPKVADSWQGVLTDNFIGGMTWELATAFGYERPASTVETDAQVSEVRRDRSSRRQALAGRRQRVEKRRTINKNKKDS